MSQNALPTLHINAVVALVHNKGAGIAFPALAAAARHRRARQSFLTDLGTGLRRSTHERARRSVHEERRCRRAMGQHETQQAVFLSAGFDET